jgi:hypothetical protein
MKTIPHLLKSSICIFLVLTNLSCCKKFDSNIHQHTIDSNLVHFRLYTYGGPPDIEYENAKKTIAEKWGIQIRSVAGCMVNQDIIDSVFENNTIVSAAIERKYGNGWADKFNKEIQNESLRQTQLRKLIEADQDFVKKNKIVDTLLIKKIKTTIK